MEEVGVKNGFSSELFFHKLGSSKQQPISYEDLLLHKLLTELFFIEIRPVTAELPNRSFSSPEGCS
jgi:hypothetical protein